MLNVAEMVLEALRSTQRICNCEEDVNQKVGKSMNVETNERKDG